jgi:hypothetical protein
MRFKFFLWAAIICLGIDLTNQVSCASENYCMACNATTANHCDACFNWGTGTVLPRALNSTTKDCKTKQTTLVTNCLFYSGTFLTTDTALTKDTCTICNKKYPWLQSKGTTTTCEKTISHKNCPMGNFFSPIKNSWRLFDHCVLYRTYQCHNLCL